MDLNRFEQCCAAFGAERRRWPPREHALFDHFAAAPEGAALLAAAEQADRFLDALAPAPPDPRLVRAIVASSKPAWRRLGAPATALAASALLGFVLGLAQVSSAADTELAARLLLGPASPLEMGL